MRWALGPILAAKTFPGITGLTSEVLKAQSSFPKTSGDAVAIARGRGTGGLGCKHGQESGGLKRQHRSRSDQVTGCRAQGAGKEDPTLSAQALCSLSDCDSGTPLLMPHMNSVVLNRSTPGPHSFFK